EVYQLAVTVVLGYGIGTAPVDTARHLAVRELIRRVPLDVLARGIGVAEAQQRRRHHRAVADPRARVRARARTDRGAVAADQDVRECRAQRVGDRLRDRGHADRDAIERFAPCRFGFAPPGYDPLLRRIAGGPHRRVA